ncbi:MAG: hypothetical protein MI745_11440, partial [Pseudomonadales bacterium]|nr:hypothetical protein [Pseudomonadales bacterium]
VGRKWLKVRELQATSFKLQREDKISRFGTLTPAPLALIAGKALQNHGTSTALQLEACGLQLSNFQPFPTDAPVTNVLSLCIRIMHRGHRNGFAGIQLLDYRRAGAGYR